MQVNCWCQTDTLRRCDPHTRYVPMIGTVMAAAGTMFTFQPELHAYTLNLRDQIQMDGHLFLHFDDYIQYAPLMVVYALNLCGVKSKHNFWETTLLAGTSLLLGGAVVEGVKHGFDIRRPDGRGLNSFPSGHTFFVFTGAEILRREYGEQYPWIAFLGYIVATTTGFMRMYNNRHWLSDVVTGAGIGLLSVSLSYELWRK